MPKKITLIGAGSVVFAKKLIGDLLQFPALVDSEICLMDIDPQRLKVAEVMTQKIISALGVPARVTATRDRTESIRGASYVICTIQVGGYEPSTVVDFEIPAKYGLKQTIADTLGVGGIFRGLRTIPKILEIARDIAEVGRGNCLLLNYSNPMAMNCWAVERDTGIPHVGLCHSVQGTSRQLASFAEIPYEDVTYKVAGINHMAFFLEFRYKGIDAYPLLFRALEDPAVFELEKVRFEMMRRLGYFVTESSEHQSEYVPYFIHHGEALIRDFSIPIDEYRRRCEAIIATWQKQEKDLLGEGEGKRFEVSPQSHEYGAYIVNAMETGEPTVIYGNVPNQDLISNLPDGCCVEVPCLVDHNGIQPTTIGALPPQLAGICRTNVNVQDLTVEAALTGKREHIYHAVMLDPHTAATLTLDAIWRMCDELIEAHQKDGYLGEFAPVVRNTGRSLAGVGDRVLAFLEAEKAFSFEEGSTNELVALLENGSDAKFAATLSVASADGEIEPVTIAVEVEAGQTARFPVSVTLLQSVDSEIAFVFSADEESVLCRGLRLKPRRILEADESGAVSFGLKLAGEDAVAASISREGDALKLSITVEDSDVVSAENTANGMNGGSGMELCIAADDKSPVRVVKLIPGKRGDESAAAAYDALGARIETATILQETTEINYRLEATVPLAAWGLKSDISAPLVDLRVLLNALGDAHSGGWTSLSGQFGKLKSLPYFCELKL